jgi:hypothetical protein
MSDEHGNRPPDEPTRAYTPVGGDDDATRLERPIAPYSEARADVPPTVLPPGYREGSSLAAPLIAVGLICVLLGIGLGYLLFHDSSSDTQDDPPSTTTTSVVASTTTTEAETTTTAKPTTTTAAPTTTTTARATTTSTTARSTTSSSVRPTTTLLPDLDTE